MSADPRCARTPIFLVPTDSGVVVSADHHSRLTDAVSGVSKSSQASTSPRRRGVTGSVCVTHLATRRCLRDANRQRLAACGYASAEGGMTDSEFGASAPVHGRITQVVIIRPV